VTVSTASTPSGARTRVGADAVALARNCRHSFSRVCANDDEHARFDDASLLSGDLGNRVTKKLLMIEVDSRNRSRHRRDDVGRVEPPAETDLQHRDIDLRLPKHVERDGGRGRRSSAAPEGL
jgi:hypothetical protein